MNRLTNGCAALLIALLPGLLFATEGGDYRLDITINPDTSLLDATVEVVLPREYAGQAAEFVLTDAVEIVTSTPAAESLPHDGSAAFSGINGSSVDLTEAGHVARYRVQFAPGESTLQIRYRGTVNFALGGQKEQYTRGFQSTAGIIGNEGVYLAGSSLWYPFFSNELVSFNLRSNVPEGWHLISQGNGSSRDTGADGAAASVWDSAGPVDEIYLVGGPLVKYQEAAGAVAAEVYLRAPDDALAQKYLTATAQYLEMYRNLIGPYPYGKFALVENFWETGYGMPSFTLLGPQIIRFPFILTSSYPHEVLHNWWGNSVFVDYETGNWCEGLTAYMADHLMQELRGTGMNWRRDTLKKYRDFVRDGSDFPLTEFRSRHSAATEAVGYGKVAMGFHMLRRELGDDVFRQALQRFYRTNRGSKAAFADVETAFAATAGQDFSTFFEQWVEWTGAPDLRLGNIMVSRRSGGWQVQGTLRQVQGDKPYQMNVPVYVTTEQGLEEFVIATDGTETEFELQALNKPLLLEIDPEFDLFRLLDPRETAPSIGQIFGEPEILAVLPAGISAGDAARYEGLIDAWRSDAHKIELLNAADFAELPDNKAVWFLGQSNQAALELFGRDPELDVDIGADALLIAGQTISQPDHSTVIIRRHPGNPAKAVGWISVAPEAAFAGMASKLPHYGKYSYLAFEGDEPANMLKGEWAATDSPLRVDLRASNTRFAAALPAARPPQRAALAELPPVFSRDRLVEHVNTLASEAMQGRGLGSPGLEMAADYIVEQFAAAGLQPGGDERDGKREYSQAFTVADSEPGGSAQVRNIVGVLPGTDPALAGQMLLVTAHYDHLGRGWPDSRAESGGGIYYGADDNASGVAVLIELARTLASEGKPKRDIVFVAFTGEEAGLLGARHFAANSTPHPAAGINAVVNMDTVGRLGEKPISVFGGSSSSDWQHIFRGIGFTTGIKSTLITTDLAASDQQAFIDIGIPGVHVSSGAALDYHRTTDTADKIDGDGLVKVAMFVKEAVVYLADRAEPLTATISAASSGAPPQRAPNGSQGGRRVSLGTVPDFAFAGQGVRIEAVVPGSPAQQAGLQPGDVLVELAGQPVANLQGYTDLLKTLEPGQSISLAVVREGERLVAEATVVSR